MKYGLGIPLPQRYGEAIERFRREHAEWEVRPMRSAPHIAIKGPAGLSEGPEVLSTAAEIARVTGRFPIQLTGPEMFDTEPILYLGVNSPGWWRLHRALVDTIAARTRAEMHAWEISGWIPHTTVLRLKPELTSRREEIIAAAECALAPLPTFEADTLRMYGQEHADARWVALCDFPLGTEPSVPPAVHSG